MITILSHLGRLMTFQHKGNGLNWDLEKAQQLVLLAFTLPFFVYAARYGVDELGRLFLLKWEVALGAIAAISLLFFHFQRVMFLRTEVGVILLCLAFYALRLTLDAFGLSAVKSITYFIHLWQISAVAWYISASRIKVRVTHQAKQ